jgi:fructoselysine 6-kinase
MKFLAMTVFCVDFYVSTGEVFVGGNSLNFAIQCAKGGIPAKDIALLGAVGNDRYGGMVKEYLWPFGFDMSHLYTLDGRTASNRIYNNENGDRYFLPDSWDDGVYGSFLLSKEDWEFALDFDVITMPANNPNFSELLRRKTGKNRLAIDFLDMMDYGLIERALPSLDILFISGDDEVISKLLPMSANTQTLMVVTLGADGSAALSRGSIYRTAAVPVSDSYIAAFCADYYRGGTIQSAMAAGSLAAFKVLSWRGGVENGLMGILR